MRAAKKRVTKGMFSQQEDAFLEQSLPLPERKEGSLTPIKNGRLLGSGVGEQVWKAL